MRDFGAVRGGLGLVALTLVGGLAGCRHQATVASSPSTPAYGRAPDLSGAGSAPIVRTQPVPPAVAERPEWTIDPGAQQISTEVGMASWYGTVYNQRRSADGQVYDQDGMTAASRTLPLGSLARVTNLTTGQVAVVRITDRGPFVPGRILDLSMGAAKATGLYRTGVGKVKVEGYATEAVVAGPGRWCVQIGAFSDPADALQLKNDLLRQFGTAKVITFKGPTGSWVRFTPAVPDKARAAEVAALVRIPDPMVEAYLTRTN